MFGLFVDVYALCLLRQLRVLQRREGRSLVGRELLECFSGVHGGCRIQYHTRGQEGMEQP